MTNLDHLIEELSDGLEPVRPIAPARGQALLGLATAATVAVTLSAWGLREDVAALHPNAMMMLSSGLFLLLAVAGGWSLTRMARPKVGASHGGWRWALAAVLVLPVTALVIAVDPAHRLGMSVDEGIGCFVGGLLASIASLAVLTWWLRQGAPMKIGTAAWLVGLTAGAVGATAVALSCPADALTHMGSWHVAIIAATGLLGRVAVPHFIRW